MARARPDDPARRPEDFSFRALIRSGHPDQAQSKGAVWVLCNSTALVYSRAMNWTLRSFLFVLALLPALHSQAACRVFGSEKEFLYAGYPISCDFSQLLESHGYTEVSSRTEADAELRVMGEDVSRARFHWARAVLELGPYRGESTMICLTQLCSIRDFGRAFAKAYQKLDRALPVCRE